MVTHRIGSTVVEQHQMNLEELQELTKVFTNSDMEHLLASFLVYDIKGFISDGYLFIQIPKPATHSLITTINKLHKPFRHLFANGAKFLPVKSSRSNVTVHKIQLRT